MSSRRNRFGMTVLLTVTLFIGILLGSTFAAAPIRVAGQGPADGETVLLQQLYQQVNSSVVSITVRVPPTGLPPSHPQVPGGAQPFDEVQGSGFVYDTQGHLVTNAHVVENANRIAVTFADDTTFIATLVGVDPDADLAVLQIAPANVKAGPLTLADSDKLAVGQRAVTIGNPFGRNGTMTQGIVSGLGRSLEGQRDSGQGRAYLIPQIVQTDAAINPGNSGGPLLDGSGAVIGITTAIESPVQQSSGVGFAVPSNIVKKVADALIKDGKIDHSYLGISGITLTMDMNELIGLEPNFHGILVSSITAGSPAANAGIKPGSIRKKLDGQDIVVGGDIIVAVDDVAVKRFEDLLGYLFVKTDPGQSVKVTVYRNGKNADLTVTLTARPITSR